MNECVYFRHKPIETQKKQHTNRRTYSHTNSRKNTKIRPNKVRMYAQPRREFALFRVSVIYSCVLLCQYYSFFEVAYWLLNCKYSVFHAATHARDAQGFGWMRQCAVNTVKCDLQIASQYEPQLFRYVAPLCRYPCVGNLHKIYYFAMFVWEKNMRILYRADFCRHIQDFSIFVLYRQTVNTH